MHSCCLVLTHSFGFLFPLSLSKAFSTMLHHFYIDFFSRSILALFCRLMDSNRGSLLMTAPARPTVPQPLLFIVKYFCIYFMSIFWFFHSTLWRLFPAFLSTCAHHLFQWPHCFKFFIHRSPNFSRPLFSLFSSFQYAVDSKQMFNI